LVVGVPDFSVVEVVEVVVVVVVVVRLTAEAFAMVARFGSGASINVAHELKLLLGDDISSTCVDF
jgi:hypothetical protein